MREFKDKMINHLSKGKDLVMRTAEPETSEEAMLAGIVADFKAEFLLTLTSLATALDDAGISHYSSGCGTQRVTYDIFPASQHVHGLIDLLSLDRLHLTKTTYGLKDATATSEYNPASEFLSFLRRWHGFAEHAMRNEGDTERGIAAARAKLIMDDLIERLSQSTAEMGSDFKVGGRINAFAAMMRALGLTLESRRRRNEEVHVVQKRESNGNNYDRALARAKERYGYLSPKAAAGMRAAQSA
jgi:hypothetical protein